MRNSDAFLQRNTTHHDSNRAHRDSHANATVAQNALCTPAPGRAACVPLPPERKRGGRATPRPFPAPRGVSSALARIGAVVVPLSCPLSLLTESRRLDGGGGGASRARADLIATAVIAAARAPASRAAAGGGGLRALTRRAADTVLHSPIVRDVVCRS